MEYNISYIKSYLTITGETKSPGGNSYLATSTPSFIYVLIVLLKFIPKCLYTY